MLLPFAAHQTLEWKVVPLALVSNVIYFTVDLCASEMEAPFGDDDMDVDMPKMIRRMDKCDTPPHPPRPAPPRPTPHHVHRQSLSPLPIPASWPHPCPLPQPPGRTPPPAPAPSPPPLSRYTASLLSVYTDGPVENYNLYPESRSTDETHHRVTKFPSMQNVYELERRRRQGGLVPFLSRRKARKAAAREAGHGEQPSPWRSEAPSPVRSEPSDFPVQRTKASRVGFRRVPSARSSSPRRADRMPEVMAAGHAEISAPPVRSHRDLMPAPVPEGRTSPAGLAQLATPATPADAPGTRGATPVCRDAGGAPTSREEARQREAPPAVHRQVYRATTSLEKSSWKLAVEMAAAVEAAPLKEPSRRAADPAPRSGSPPEAGARELTAEGDSPPRAAAGDCRLSPNIKKSLGLRARQGDAVPPSLQHAQSTSDSQTPREKQPAAPPAPPAAGPPAPPPAGPPPPPRRRLPRSASASPVSGEVRMAASQLSPIIDSPPAPQPPPGESEGESAQLPSVEARLRTSTAAGGSGAVAGVTVQVLEGGEDEEAPTQAKDEAPSRRDSDRPPPGGSARRDVGGETPRRDSGRSEPRQESASPSPARGTGGGQEVRSAAQKSYLIQRMALGPGPFAQHSPSAPSLAEARSSSSLLEASQQSPSRHSASTSSSSLDDLSAMPKEEMQQLALARNAAAGPCARHSPNSSPDSRALEALGRSALAPSSSSVAPRRRGPSPTAAAKKPAGGPPKKKPTKGPAKAPAKKVPVRRAEPSFAEPSLPHRAPRAMGHQMTATEAEAEASDEEDEGQEGGDFD